MNKELQKVVDECSGIIEAREAERAKLHAEIAKVEADLAKARESRESAADAESIIAAIKTEAIAPDLLAALHDAEDAVNRPIEAERYSKMKSVLHSCAQDAASDLQKRVDEIIAQLAPLYAEYCRQMDEINEASKVVDKAAMVLQSEYGRWWVFERTKFDADARKAYYIDKDRARVHAWRLMQELAKR